MPTSPPCPRRGENATTPASEGVVKGNSAGIESSASAMHWLPADTEEQLALGFRTISNAHKTKVAAMEREIRNARSELEEAKAQISSLQRKVAAVEHELLEQQQRAHTLKDENGALVGVIKKLQNRIDRLESVRNAVLSSIQNGDTTAEEDMDRFMLTSDFNVTAFAPLTFSEEATSTTGGADMMFHHRCFNRGEGSSSAYPGGVSSSPGRQRGATAANTFGNHPVQAVRQETVVPPRSADPPPRNFFRTVRQRVDYDRFQSFISIVRKLNSKTQTMEETLAQARKLFGDDYADLTDEFAEVLKKHAAAPTPLPC